MDDELPRKSKTSAATRGGMRAMVSSSNHERFCALVLPPSLERVSHRCSGRPLGRPSDGLKPVAYTHVKNAVKLRRTAVARSAEPGRQAQDERWLDPFNARNQCLASS